MNNQWENKAIEVKGRNDRRVRAISAEGAGNARELSRATSAPPSASAGVLVIGVDAWAENVSYEQYDLFAYNGAVGFVKQAHTASSAWIPFSQGTEALYGARPTPDDNGVYPYVYNMSAKVGMRVKDPTDGLVYVCIQGIGDMLFEPHRIPAHFTPE